jgi:hypothetical protein
MFKDKPLILALAAGQLLTLILAALLWLRPAGPRPALSFEQAREHAAELKRRELYGPAVEAYHKLLELYAESRPQAAGIHLIVGDILDQNLHQPEPALAEYLLADQLAERASLRSDARQKVVAVLERLGRNVEAASAASAYTRADAAAQAPVDPQQVVAEVGGTKLTRAQFQRELERLPPEAQQQVAGSPQAKADFLKSWVARELLYQSGVRRGLDQDAGLQAQLENVRRSLVSERALRAEVGGQPAPTAEELELYYQAHADRYLKDPKDPKSVAPFQEVQQQVAQERLQEQQQKQVRALFERLLQASDAKLYPERL